MGKPNSKVIRQLIQMLLSYAKVNIILEFRTLKCCSLQKPYLLKKSPPFFSPRKTNGFSELGYKFAQMCNYNLDTV